jgi:hypothetical protein
MKKDTEGMVDMEDKVNWTWGTCEDIVEIEDIADM